MSGSGVIDVVDRASDKDGNPVWRLILRDSPGNADARAMLWANGRMKAEFEPSVAIDMDRRRYPDCPVKAGDEIAWDAHHITFGGERFGKHGWEYDPEARV